MIDLIILKIILGFKITYSIYYFFGLFCTSSTHTIFKRYYEGLLFFIYKQSNFISEWALFNGLKLHGYDLKITAKTKKTQHVWYLAKDNTIGNFTIKSSSSRSNLCQLYTRQNKIYLNYFYKMHLQKYFLSKGDELLELIIDPVYVYMGSEDFDYIKYRLSRPHKLQDLQQKPYIWKKENEHNRIN